MDTKPIRELIEAVEDSLHCLWQGGYTASFSLLKRKIAAAERALTEEARPTAIGTLILEQEREYLERSREVLRLAEELSRVVLSKQYGEIDRLTAARAYRQARGLERENGVKNKLGWTC